MEEWRDIRGYEGLYQVSDRGRVRSLDRMTRNHRCGTERLVIGRIMIPHDNGNGYLTVSLSKQCKAKRKYIHRLVAEAFIPNPNHKSQVNHLDYNKTNNRCDNLEWCTAQENTLFSSDRMRHPKSNITNMHIPKSNPRQTSTGYRHIGQRNGWYRVHIRAIGVDKQFKTLCEAVEYRDRVVKETGWLTP